MTSKVSVAWGTSAPLVTTLGRFVSDFLVASNFTRLFDWLSSEVSRVSFRFSDDRLTPTFLFGSLKKSSSSGSSCCKEVEWLPVDELG
jgi:hypothetical protein